MKRLIFICLLCPAVAMAQKEIKPNVNKAESALQKGNLDEAKAIIDVTVSSQEYMVDKKGGPSKNAAKAWYLKGLIYAAIDTTKETKYKSLDANPFPVAKEAFTKAEELDKGKNESLVSRLFVGQQLPMTKKEVNSTLAQTYLNRGYEIYKTKDYKKAFVDIEKVVFFFPTDTTQLMNAGVYFGPAAEEDDKSIDYINKYLAGGGKNADAYVQLYSIYSKRKNNDEALRVIKELTARYPDNIDYLNMEYNLYVQMNNIEGAKALMLKRAEGDKNDTESRYFLVLIAKKQEKLDEARRWVEDILKINPDHFEANEEMAAILNKEQRILSDQRNATNDVKKRLDLRNQRFAKLKEILPYAEKCVNIKPTDENSLYTLLLLYDNLSAFDESYEKKIPDLKKKMKSLGMEVD